MTTPMNITAAVEASREGDLGAFETLVRSHTASSLGYARALLRDERAEEAVQDAFIEAYRGLHSLREPAAFPGWLRRIVHKQCDRRMRRIRELASDSLEATSPVNAESQLETSERWTAFRATLEALPEHERVVASLHHLGDAPIQEIARFLQLSPGAVKTRLSRARARMRDALESTMMPSPHPLCTMPSASFSRFVPAIRRPSTPCSTGGPS